MSVLNFPRIYVNGHMFWNPPTANNNDMLPLYDAVNMQMNWRFLEQYGITPDNASPKLLNWMTSPLQQAQVPDYVLGVPGNSSAFPAIPAEWDLFGDNGCGTVDYQQTHSTVIGGELQASTYVDQDSLINKQYQLLGNPFGSTKPTPARFVDISPWQNTFTALYFDKLVIGDKTEGITLNRQYRMLDKFLNFNWGALGGLNYVTTTWQTCFPRENLEWVLGTSNLLKQLQSQMEQQNALGLMFRFSTYLTFYDKNGIFNNYPPVDTRTTTPAALAKLQALYQAGLENVADIVFNPAYNSTAGTLGLWLKDEFPSVPGGRRLTPKNPVSLYKLDSKELPNPAIDPTASLTLGVMLAEANGDTLSLDVSNTFPFYPIDPKADIPVPLKFYAGNFDIGIKNNDVFEKITTLDFDQYSQKSFDLRSGLVDIALSKDQQSKLQTGALELRLQSETINETLVSQQMMWTADVVESGTFINVGESKTLNIMVQYDGLPAPAGTVLWVAQYGNPFMLTTSDYYLCFTNDANFALYQDYPEDRSKNTADLPQFAGTSEPPLCTTVGSGRLLTAVQTEVADSSGGTAVKYQDYRKTPAGMALAPCVSFVNPISKQGTLESPDSSQVDYQMTKIQTDANGIAQLPIKAIAPGFPTLRFFVQEGQQQPAIPFSFNYSEAYTDFLAPLRVLPQEPQMMQDFVDYWNSIYQQAEASQLIWNNFIYPKILRPFYYLYPIMDKYMPLDSLSRVEGAVDQLLVLVSQDYQEQSTLAMPITRDMPQSRRAVIERWANDLVKRNYPPQPLS
jgi:hypothetical protein